MRVCIDLANTWYSDLIGTIAYVDVERGITGVLFYGHGVVHVPSSLVIPFI